MFSRLLRKKKGAERQYPVLQRIGAFINKKQQRLADYLQQKMSGYSKTKLTLLLILFCLLWGGGSAYVIWRGLSNKAAVLTVETSMNAPRLIYEDSVYRPNHFDSAIVSSRIRLFRNYMDSLRRSSPRRYDSILSVRPGLMDSLRVVEKLYNQ